MFRLIWVASVRTHTILRYAPANLLIAATRARRGLRWGIPAMLLAIPHLLVAYWCVTTIEAGGPGWLNLLVLLCAWNSIKLILNGPVTVALLLRARVREAVARRRADGPITTNRASTPKSTPLTAHRNRRLPTETSTVARAESQYLRVV